MNIENIRKALERQYSIVDIIDLGEISAAPSNAHNFFKKNFKDTYADNERIVLYTQYDIPIQLLNHIAETINFLDIDSFFILFCTSSPINELLNKIPNNKFQNKIVFLNNTKEIQNAYYIPPETFCAIPWHNLEIQQDGNITPCCSSKDYSLGNIYNISLKNAFYGDKMQKLRSDLMTGVKNSACGECWMKEEKGLKSMRLHNQKRLTEHFFEELSNDTKITGLDIKFSNVCNFSCVICNPTNSSMRAIEDHKFKNIPLTPTIKWSDTDSFLDQMNELLPDLTNIDMFGGEPFLNKSFKNILKNAVDKGYAKHIRLHYNSNGSVWPESFIEYWPYFKEVDIHFSIDATGKQFEYQRGGDWSEVEENVLKIKNLNMTNMTISLMPSISILNVYYLDRVIDWALKNGFKNIFENFVAHPQGFSLRNLTKSAKELICEKYKNYTAWPEMQNVVSFIDKVEDATGKEFRNEISYFDRVRNKNFADDHKEIAIAMGYKL